MGTVLPTGYAQWRSYMGEGAASRTTQDYAEWLRSNGMSANEFIDLSRSGGVQPSDLTNPLTGQPYPSPLQSGIPVPGQPAPTAPGGGLTQIPTGPTGPPAFAPPQVAMPQPTPNPTPQGLGGMPMIRDRMMGATMAPFAQPNWGVPQVPQQYLTSQQPLPGGDVSNIPVGPGAPAGGGLSEFREAFRANPGGGLMNPLRTGLPQGGISPGLMAPVGMSNPNQQLMPVPAPQGQKVPMVGLGQMGIPRRVKQGLGSR